MFKALILPAQHNLSDARMEFMILDRLSSTDGLGITTSASGDGAWVRPWRYRCSG
ncbi:hypothetical protein [Sphingobium sp. YR768]|uniref:hypothetical protein n=1 Tax=Sphingobium sp. YR768 TaxID=1884365 RepID=UPI0035273703